MPEGAPGLLLLDTHVWIWTVEGSKDRLSRSAVRTIERASRAGRIRVAAISVWEVAMLESRGRLRLARPVDEWVRAALRAPGVHLLPLAPEIAVESTRLPGELPGDPADRMLVASARVAGARLVSCDARIIGYGDTGHLNTLDARP